MHDFMLPFRDIFFLEIFMIVDHDPGSESENSTLKNRLCAFLSVFYVSQCSLTRPVCSALLGETHVCACVTVDICYSEGLSHYSPFL